MEVKKINMELSSPKDISPAKEKLMNINVHTRPNTFDEFIGQEHIKGVVKTAIES